MFAPSDTTADLGDEDPSYAPVALAARRNGWTAERQRRFLTNLAETGSVSQACGWAGVSSRSAYRLRARPDALGFARGWDEALKLASLRLMTLAFERATRGGIKETWRDNELVQTTRAPSDRMLIFLLDRMLPAGDAGARWSGFEGMVEHARTAFPQTLATLADNAVEMVPLQVQDFYGEPPRDVDDHS